MLYNLTCCNKIIPLCIFFFFSTPVCVVFCLLFFFIWGYIRQETARLNWSDCWVDTHVRRVMHAYFFSFFFFSYKPDACMHDIYIHLFLFSYFSFEFFFLTFFYKKNLIIIITVFFHPLVFSFLYKRLNKLK